MKGLGSPAMHALVMCVTLVCLTVLGVTHTLNADALGVIFAGICGVVFGSAAAQSGTNGATRSAVEVALEQGHQAGAPPAPRERERGAR